MIAAVGTGFAISQLMIIGHDACHQALAKSSLLNKIIGRVGFIFCLHSYSAWDLLHNKLHHRYTNIKGIDPVWSPLTKSEYDNLNWFRQTSCCK
jgi:omega-6 fatty acid desaturase (delta-12 desaturase)